MNRRLLLWSASQASALGRAREHRCLEQRAEALRLEQVTLPEVQRLRLRCRFRGASGFAGGADPEELGEDRLRFRVARVHGLAVLGDEPVAQLVEALVGGEDAPHDELRRDRPVPAVLGEAERNVPAMRLPVDVETGAAAERDRTAGVGAVAPHAEAQVLSLADGREFAQLAARREERDLGIAEAERREPRGV